MPLCQIQGDQAVAYSWGNEPLTPEQANFGYNEGTWTIVGSYPPGNYGLFDMAGNVWEWTASKYMAYPYKVKEGREENIGIGDTVSLRGGSFINYGNSVRCADRLRNSPIVRDSSFDFRVVSPGF